jgi:hypothetical protein
MAGMGMTVIEPNQPLTPSQIVPRPSDPVSDVMGQQSASGDGRGRAQPFTHDEMVRAIDEIHHQPDFRKQQDRDCEYYDNNQLAPDTLAEIERRGMLPVVRNLIQPTIDVVLGLEAKLRTDARCAADSDTDQDVAEGLSQRLKEVTREAMVNEVLADAFASQVKAGIGWAEVVRASDPFAYPYEVNHVHRREMYWKWEANKPLLQDSAYMIRRRFFDDTAVMAYFPHAAPMLKDMASGFPMDYLLRSNTEVANNGFELGEDAIHRWSMEEWEWRNPDRRRLALFETHYRRYVRGYYFRNPRNGQAIELNLRNPLHKALVGNGQVKPQIAVYTKLRRAIFCGPLKLYDGDVNSRMTPYIPFIAYREDLTNIPYGLIRTMISPQDEINARAQKMLWLLGAKRITMDADALDIKSNDLSEVLAEIGRADAAVVLNPDRKNRDRDAFYVDDNLSLADAQYKVLLDNIQSMQQVRGIFSAMLGSDSSASSGIAINSLIEQSTTVLAKVLSNQKTSKRAVHEQIVEMLSQDMTGQPVEIVVKEVGSRKKVIILNQPMVDEATGMQYLKNDVSRSNIKVAIEDVTASPAYRGQQLSMISEVVKGLPPEGQMIIVPAFIEATEIPDRAKYADQFRKITGMVDPEAMTPEEQQAYAEEQAYNAQMQKAMGEAALAEQQAKANKLQAEAQVALNQINGLDAGNEQAVQEAVAQVQMVANKQLEALQSEIAQLKVKMADRKMEIAVAHQTALRKAAIDGSAKVEVERVRAESHANTADMANQLKEIEDRLLETVRQVEEGLQDALDQEREAAREKELSEREAELNERDSRGAKEVDDIKQRAMQESKAETDRRRSEQAVVSQITEVASAVKDLARQVKSVEREVGKVQQTAAAPAAVATSSTPATSEKPQKKKPKAPREVDFELDKDGVPVAVKFGNRRVSIQSDESGMPIKAVIESGESAGEG